MRTAAVFRIQGMEIQGTLEASTEGENLVLSDPRDEFFQTQSLEGTEIVIPIPIHLADPFLRLPCGCLSGFTGKYQVVECSCKRAWIIRHTTSETIVQEQGTWNRRNNST